MKKNISINISGIIFHIEEDAYENLRDYLQSINRYFSSFEDSDEIIADIESRIAEIFLLKLNDEKQVITLGDVDGLIATMGNVSDFKAMEEEPVIQPEPESDNSYKAYETETRRLFRDESRRVIGGVCSGIAHYFKIDPVWIRLAFVLSLLVYGFGIIPYIILWIVVPGKYDLPEQKNFRKMYRNPDEKVLGGVSSGIAAYFGVDIIVIRLLFVIFAVFGGTGILVYIVLWIALPEASSISEKVRMQGDPVTLENIESNIKKNLNIDEKKEEDTITKILLFPFRLIATILKGIGKILGPILMFFVEAVRILVGILLVFVGFVLAFAFLVTTAALFGVVMSQPFGQDVMIGDWGIPMDIISNSFPTLTVIATGILVLVPSIFMALLGISVIAKRIVFNATVGWTLLAFFIVSSIFLSINIPSIVYQFKEEGSFDETTEYAYNGQTAVLDINEVGMDDYDAAKLRLRGHADSVYRLVLTFEAQGSTRLNAADNARMIEYSVNKEDSVFIFDSNITFKPEAVFRGQDVLATLYIPYGSEFVIKRPIRYILDNRLYTFNYNSSELNEVRWTMQEDVGLVCLTCPEEVPEELDAQDSTYEFSANFRSMETLQAFRELTLNGPIVTNIQHGDEFKIMVSDQGADRWEEVVRNQDDVRLDISLKEITEDDPLMITIVVPDLEQIHLKGSARAIITDLEQEYFEIRLDDESNLTADIDISDLVIEMNDNSNAELYGTGRDMKIDLQGFSNLNAYEFTSIITELKARGQSKAEVFVSNQLRLDKSITARVAYKGDPQIIETE